MIFSDIILYAFICIENLYWYISSMNNLPLHGNQRVSIHRWLALGLRSLPHRSKPERSVRLMQVPWVFMLRGRRLPWFYHGVPRPLGDYSFNGLSGKDCYF